jgi:class 3 adenylate cyclase
VFADICGSTSLYDELGDDLARHFTANCIKIMVREISLFKGTLIKTIGDEIMCTFPNAKLALNAACAMQNAVKNSGANSKQPLSIRIGFHYGFVICETNDVFGDTVNVAARVAGLAKADQILTTSAVYQCQSERQAGTM